MKKELSENELKKFKELANKNKTVNGFKVETCEYCGAIIDSETMECTGCGAKKSSK